MKKIENFFVLMLIVLTFFCMNTSYAAFVEVTDENLKDALEKFEKSETNDKNYQIVVENNVITVKFEEEIYQLNYDLTDKPTFYLEIPIEKGMSYKEYKNKDDNLILPMLGYLAAANIQDVEFEDSMLYFSMSYLSSAFNKKNENSYVLIDDLDVPDEEFFYKTDDPRYIYTSDFPEKVMEYVSDLYSEPLVLDDNDGGISSYTFSTQLKNKTDTSCTIVASLSVNTEADFSVIKDYGKKVEDSLKPDGFTKETADYLIKMKVGQVCKLKTEDEVTGYAMFGRGAEFDRKLLEITAKSPGESWGYIYFGDDVKKSFYVIVEENETGEDEKTITLIIDKNTSNPDNKQDDDKKDNINNKNENKNSNTNTNFNKNVSNIVNLNTNNIDNSVSNKLLPNTGIGRIGIVIITISIIGIYCYKKYVSYNKMF